MKGLYLFRVSKLGISTYWILTLFSISGNCEFQYPRLIQYPGLLLLVIFCGSTVKFPFLDAKLATRGSKLQTASVPHANMPIKLNDRQGVCANKTLTKSPLLEYQFGNRVTKGTNWGRFLEVLNLWEMGSILLIQVRSCTTKKFISNLKCPAG